MAKKKKIEFLMNTDWMFEKPIDREYKEYKLLSYFQKMGEKLDRLELYPGFIELSLHLMNVQALIKDKKIVYTDKKLNNIDDEILVKDLKVRALPELSQDEMIEFRDILTFSAPRIMEYFSIAKSVYYTQRGTSFILKMNPKRHTFGNIQSKKKQKITHRV
jgi:hypothetical protein